MSNRSNVTARTALTNLILSRCSVGRGRPLLRDSTQRSVGKMSEDAVAPAEEKEAIDNHDDENVNNDDMMKEKGAKQGFEDDTNLLEHKETKILMKMSFWRQFSLSNLNNMVTKIHVISILNSFTMYTRRILYMSLSGMK